MANDVTKLSLDALNSLSPEEKQLAIEILKQYSEQGESTILDQLQYADFDEIPVDIETFMHDEKYLGKALIDPEGRFTVFPYWEKTLKDIFPTNTTTKYNNVVFTGAIGLGKAQPLDSQVLTEHGYKPMGEITLEDRVYGKDGELHKVVGIFPQGKKKVCRVTFSDGVSTLCCDEHLWTVKDTETGKTFTAETKELLMLKGYSNRYEIPMTKPINFKANKKYEKGWLYNEGVHIGILCDAESATAHIEEELLYANIKDRIELLQGILDTKGELIVENSEIYLNVAGAKLAKDISWLVQSLGGTCFDKDDHVYHRLYITLPRGINPFKHKYKRYQSKRLDKPTRTITWIEYVEDQECQCIVVDSKDHLYLTNDFIVTHNSTIAVICLLYLLYRLLCLKDPYLYYGMQPIDKITISLMNITLDNAKGVALDKMNQMILTSDWFMHHGEMGGVTNLIYHPEKHIEVIVASSNNQIIGRALFANFTDRRVNRA